MRNTRRTIAAAFAAALALPAAGAAAAPVDVQIVLGVIRHYYPDVRIVADSSDEGFTSVTLQSRNAGGTPLTVPVENGQVAEADVTTLVGWLAPFESAGRTDALETLQSYTQAPDQGRAAAAVERLGLASVRMGQHRVAYFTRGGRRLAEVPGGEEASVGQVVDAMEAAVAGQLAAQSVADESLVLPPDLIDTMDEFIEQSLDERTFPDAPPLAPGDGTTRREALARNIAAGIEDARRENGSPVEADVLSVDDLEDAYESSGISVDMQVDENERLTVFRTSPGQPREVIAANVQVYSGSAPGGSGQFLTVQGRLALAGQSEGVTDLEEAWTESLSNEQIEKMMARYRQDAEGKRPEGPDEPGSGEGRSGDGDGPQGN